MGIDWTCECDDWPLAALDTDPTTKSATYTSDLIPFAIAWTSAP